MNHVLSILVPAIVLPACVGWGSLWLRAFGRPITRDLYDLTLSAALGLGTMGHLVLGLGLLGRLSPFVLATPVAMGLVLLAVYGRGAFVGGARGTRRSDTSDQSDASDAERPLVQGKALSLPTAALGIYLGLLALMTLFYALRPVDGLDWDGLSYHLAAPKIYLTEGRIHHIAYDSHTNFPFTMEMLYLLGLRFAGDGAARLFHWAAGWLTVLAIGAWTSRLQVAGRRVPGWAAWLAAATFASMPIVLWEMGTAYVDLGTALFQLLALTVLIDGVRLEDGKARLDGSAGLLAGVLSGFALGTKYTALIQFGLLGLGCLWLCFRAAPASRRTSFAATIGFGIAAVLIALPWYLKNWLWVHNPVHPFFYSLFPNSFSWDREAADSYAGEQVTFGRGPHPMTVLSELKALVSPPDPPPLNPPTWTDTLLKIPQTAVRAVMALWDLAIHGRAFYINERSIIGDKLGSFGPLYAAILPLGLWVDGLGWKVRALLAYGGGSLLFWFFLTQQSRYLTPVFAPLAIVIGAILAALPERPIRQVALTVAGVSLAGSLLLFVPFFTFAMSAVTGQVSREAYLTQSLGGLPEAAKYVNHLPEDSRVALYQETRGYYFDRKYFWANPLQHTLVPYASLKTGDELVGALRRFGITHVLINFDFAQGVQNFGWYRLLMDAVQKDRLRETFRTQDAELGRRGIVIYRLREAGSDQ